MTDYLSLLFNLTACGIDFERHLINKFNLIL